MVPWKHFLLAFLAAAALSALTALSGCNRKADADAPADQSADRRASIGSLKRQLDEVSDRLQTLEDKAAQAGSKVKQEVRDEIGELEVKRDQLYGKLQELQSAGADGWEALKDNAASGVDSLGRAVNRTWKNLTADERTAEAEAREKDR
jgi:TolA-binding protein